MGADDIGKLLEHSYPKYLTYKEIAAILGISKRSVMTVLSKMRKRGEVEYIIVKSDTNTGVWITKYRIRRK